MKSFINYLLGITVNLVLLTGCEKDPDAVKAPTNEIPVIKGIYQYTVVGDHYGTIGNPNVNRSEDNLVMSTFPNPGNYFTQVWYDFRRPVGSAKLWITPAIWEGQEIRGAYNNGLHYTSGGLPVFVVTLIPPTGIVQTSWLAPGYYRIYILADDIILYDNLVITENLY